MKISGTHGPPTKITGGPGCIVQGKDRNGDTFSVPEELAQRLIAAGCATAGGETAPEVAEDETATREAPEVAATRTTRTTRATKAGRRRRRG